MTRDAYTDSGDCYIEHVCTQHDRYRCEDCAADETEPEPDDATIELGTWHLWLSDVVARAVEMTAERCSGCEVRTAEVPIARGESFCIGRAAMLVGFVLGGTV